jgi:hypothetical protein
MAVPRFELTAALKAEDDWIARFPVFDHGRVELRQTLQAPGTSRSRSSMADAALSINDRVDPYVAFDARAPGFIG